MSGAGPSPYLYPPGASTAHLGSSTAHLVPPKDALDRELARTPSPTPSEAAELAREGALDWKRLRDWRFWIRREWLWYYILTIVIVAVVALVTIFHSKIVDYLKPAANFLKGLPAGWLIPVGILFVISFPPLFGHEIIAVLCGVVWGLGVGFAIVCAGTFLGEVGNFYAFKWCCRARGEKLERTNITYGVLARVVREGGLKIALVARLSAIPGHFTTAVFSSCGMGIFTFSFAALLSLPKQFVTVYLGVLIDTSDQETTAQRLGSYAVVAVTIAITVLAMWYIYREMNRVKPLYIYDRRRARGAKLAAPSPTGAYSPREPHAQQWDAAGRATGASPNPAFLQQPAPQHGRVPTFRTDGGGGYDSRGARYPTEDQGASYPLSPRADGRAPVRQASDSDESYETAREREASDAYSAQQHQYNGGLHLPPQHRGQGSPADRQGPWTPVSVKGPFPTLDFRPPPGTPTHPYGRGPTHEPSQRSPPREKQGYSPSQRSPPREQGWQQHSPQQRSPPREQGYAAAQGYAPQQQQRSPPRERRYSREQQPPRRYSQEQQPYAAVQPQRQYTTSPPPRHHASPPPQQQQRRYSRDQHQYPQAQPQRQYTTSPPPAQQQQYSPSQRSPPRERRYSREQQPQRGYTTSPPPRQQTYQQPDYGYDPYAPPQQAYGQQAGYGQGAYEDPYGAPGGAYAR